MKHDELLNIDWGAGIYYLFQISTDMTDMAHKIHHHTARGSKHSARHARDIDMLDTDWGEDILYLTPNIVMIAHWEDYIGQGQPRKPD